MKKINISPIGLLIIFGIICIFINVPVFLPSIILIPSILILTIVYKDIELINRLVILTDIVVVQIIVFSVIPSESDLYSTTHYSVYYLIIVLYVLVLTTLTTVFRGKEIRKEFKKYTRIF